MQKPLIKSCAEFAILTSLCLIFFYGVAQLARESLLFEIAFCVALPVLVYFSKIGGEAKLPSRILQLLLIESFFLLIAIGSKISIVLDANTVNVSLNYMFYIFFVGQTTLFVLYQYKTKAFFGMLRSAMLFLMLTVWFLSSAKVSYLDQDGRLLFWNGDAPLAIQYYYCIWVAGVLLVDSALLPNYRQVFPHAASVCVALLSGEFFHVRLLTACHLFVLDMLFSYTSDKSLKDCNSSFCMITDSQQEKYDRHVRKPFDWLFLIVCVSIFIYFVAKKV